MKHTIRMLSFVLIFLLTGCGWMNRSYVSVEPHREQRQSVQADAIMASNYLELLDALRDMIASGTEVAAIKVPEYPEDALSSAMERAVLHTRINNPIGAYAVTDIDYELGSSGGIPAISVSIAYHHNRSEIQRIRKASNIQAAERLAAEALRNYEPVIVILVDEYENRDFSQFVQDYGQENPQIIMEIPQVRQNTYGTGKDRLLELIFTYQTSRDSLRQMQAQVQRIFASAALYINPDAADPLKYEQLYNFLMERSDYQIETSITPAYSLLTHGVGDSETFAMVYAAMCRQADLDCMIVSGTRQGEPWYWNLIREEERYYHLDLLRCSEAGQFQKLTDAEMQGYVWDYSAYPGQEKE